MLLTSLLKHTRHPHPYHPTGKKKTKKKRIIKNSSRFPSALMCQTHSLNTRPSVAPYNLCLASSVDSGGAELPVLEEDEYFIFSVDDEM